MASLDGMVAIVVGAADGIGRATALRLAESGADVVLAFHSNSAGVEQGLADVLKTGRRAIAVKVDHTQENDVKALVDKTMAEFGKINILVNNAAGTSPAMQKRDRDVVSMDAEYWDTAMAINLRGPMLTCKHTIPRMIEAGYGAIVNTGSGVVFRGDTVRTAYSASKIGLHSLTMDIATTYGKQNIRCNVVSPGIVLTNLVRDLLDESTIAALTGQNLVPFVGEPDDIAHVSVFLASPAARYITGQIIAVDGGMHVHQCLCGMG